jgi:hypothetical protein
MRIRCAPVFFTALLLFSQERDVAKLAEYQHAQDVAREVMEGTRALLMKEMQAKGAAGAIQACSAVALDLAKKHEREGWRIRRVSLKLRNPADAPDAFEERQLARFAAQHAEGKLPAEGHAEVVKEAGRNYLRYMRPILISAPLCLQCHGTFEDMSPEVQSRLQQLYPNDRATGYRLKDLRGAVSIRIPLAD